MSDAALHEAQLKRSRDVARSIRQMIRDSLPTSPDQFLTLMVPGISLDLKVSEMRNKRPGH